MPPQPLPFSTVARSIARPPLTRFRDDTARQALDVGADLAGAREPDAIAVTDDVLQRAPQLRQPIRPAHHERVQRDRAHERLARRLPEQLVELVHDHVGELARGVLVPDDAARVVHLDRIGHREQPPAAGLEPHGLIVHRPVHRVAVARLLEQVERDRRVREPRAHPADGAPALVPLDGGGDARDHGALLVLGHVLLALGVRHAVTDDLVAALSQPLGDVGGGLVDLDVHLRLDRQVELVEEVEEPPDPDAVAVVTPGIDAGAHRLVGRRDGDALAHAKAERFDVDRDVYGEARAVRPRVVRPLRDVGVVVASVAGQRHTTSYGRRGLSRISSYGYENAWPVMRASVDGSTRGPTPERNAGSRIGANITRSCMSCWMRCSSASRFLGSTSTACSRNNPSMSGWPP